MSNRIVSRASVRRTTSTYSRVRRRLLVNGTPYQPSLTCGPLSPSPSRKRPSLKTSSETAAIAVAVARRAGICIRPEPRPIRSVLPASMPEHRDGVLAPRLGDPRRVQPEAVGEHGKLDLLGRREPRPVGEEDSRAHQR